MTEYEEFIKPHLKPKDRFEHVVVLRYYGWTFGSPQKSKYKVNIELTNFLDGVFVSMQKDGYEIIQFDTEKEDDTNRFSMIIRYK